MARYVNTVITLEYLGSFVSGGGVLRVVPVKHLKNQSQKYAVVGTIESAPPLVLVDTKSDVKEGAAHSLAGLVRRETDQDILEISTSFSSDYVEPSTSVAWKTKSSRGSG